MQAKKMAFSNGLSTIWGPCRLGGHYLIKPENVTCILRRIKLHTIQYQNLHQNTGTVPGICFILVTIAPNSVPLWTIKINVFSHICILHNNSKWTDAWLPFFGLFYLFSDRFQLNGPRKFLYSFAHVQRCYAHHKQFGKWPLFCFQPLTRLLSHISAWQSYKTTESNISTWRSCLKRIMLSNNIFVVQ